MFSSFNIFGKSFQGYAKYALLFVLFFGVCGVFVAQEGTLRIPSWNVKGKTWTRRADSSTLKIAAAVDGEEFYVPKTISFSGVTSGTYGGSASQSGLFKKFGFMAGMNLGGAKPGYDPGELPLTFDDYMRYFSYMKQLNSNVARIYTILPPSFYEALYEYNQQNPNDPIFVLHGIWSPEEELSGEEGRGSDAFETEIVDIMKDNIFRCVSAVHGAGTLRYTYTKQGEFSVSIAPYVIGWVMGTEWYPFAVNVTNSAHVGMKPFVGKYVQSNANASPFENWIAEMLNEVALQDASFGWERPLTFTNWVTTDPLNQPLEPRFDISEEDWMSVDASHIDTTSEWKSGYFINFHAYPYSPDFLHYKFKDYFIPPSVVNGVKDEDPYFAYLHRLRIFSKGFPLLITEVGLPTSFGSAHDGYKNRDHGHISEQDQGIMLEEVLLEMKRLNINGVMLFELFDEWFKKSWNVLLIDTNRKTWMNPLSCEQYFGLIAVEPTRPVYVDADASDWSDIPNVVGNYEELRQFSVTHDAEYFYLLAESKKPWNEASEFWIGIDSIKGGSYKSELSQVKFKRPVDYLIKYYNGTATVYSSIANDMYTRLYGEWLEGYDHDEFPVDDSFSGRFVKWRLLTKIPTEVPRFNSSFSNYIPHSIFNASDLIEGSSHPEKDDFDNLSMFKATGTTLEMRIPWMLIGFGDPSTHSTFRLSDINRETVSKSERSTGLHIQPTFLDEINSAEPYKYEWEDWLESCHCERFKAGAYKIADFFDHVRNNIGSTYVPSSNGNYFPTKSQYCECPSESEELQESSTYQFHKWFALISVLFLISQLFYAGLLRPVLNQVFFCYYFRKGKKEENIRSLQVVNFIIFSGVFIVIMLYYADGDYSNIFRMISDYIDSLVDAGQQFDFAYALYWLSLNWDGLLVLSFAIFIRMPKALPDKNFFEKEEETEDETINGIDPSHFEEIYCSPTPSVVNEPIESSDDDMVSIHGNDESSQITKIENQNEVIDMNDAMPEFPLSSEPMLNTERCHAFVIACHNSSAKIRNTLEVILLHCEPWQIFVADNGSTKKEKRRTERICFEVSYWYREVHPGYRGHPVNYGYIPQGSKTIAQFAACYSIFNYERNIEFVTLIDDDTKVPPNWSENEIKDIFDKNEQTKCIAYALCAGNKEFALPQFQNFEYLLAGYMKIVQARLGTALFASGAFSTWRTEYILDVLFRHDTMHHGDDLQQGLLLHKMAGKSWVVNPEEVHIGNYKVDVASRILIPTDVPVCWVHWRDIVPDFIKRKLKVKKPCSCGEPSLFIQRAKGWDVSRQRFLWKYVKMICYWKEMFHWRGLFAKLVAIHDSILIINDWITMIYGIILFILSESKMFFVLGLVISWAFQVFVYIVFDFLVLSPAGYHVVPEVRVVFPLVYKLPTLTVIRLYGMFYNLFYYLPFVRNKTKINKLYGNEEEFKDMVETAYPESSSDGSSTSGESNSLGSFELDPEMTEIRAQMQNNFIQGRNVFDDFAMMRDNSRELGLRIPNNLYAFRHNRNEVLGNVGAQKCSLPHSLSLPDLKKKTM
eukprot:Nk52_evm51s152 gene=Nk52_evmTU51s152